jgi:thiamine biosynthesis lipoprotein ApbE
MCLPDTVTVIAKYAATARSISTNTQLLGAAQRKGRTEEKEEKEENQENQEKG